MVIFLSSAVIFVDFCLILCVFDGLIGLSRTGVVSGVERLSG